MGEISLEEIKQEWMNTRKQLLATGASAIALLSAGAIFFHSVENLSWVDAFYFCTVSLATVGYGDITPRTDAEKVFIIFYVFVGIGIFATFANLWVKNARLRRELRLAKKQRKNRRIR
jgi:voltage-gated potassium channel Kch